VDKAYCGPEGPLVSLRHPMLESLQIKAFGQIGVAMSVCWRLVVVGFHTTFMICV
jgi:hypothetical protein